MTSDHPKETVSREEPPASRGKFVRLSESLPPIDLEVEYYDPEVAGAVCSRGKPVRLCESLPPVECEMATPSAWPALVLRVTDSGAEAVVDMVLGLLNEDWAAGGRGLTRDRSRETPEPGVLTLALVPEGQPGPEAEARLRELARRVTSPTVTATVIPAA